MKKPVVYLETSFVSCLTGWWSPLEHVRARQAASLAWWEREGAKWHVVVSQTVLDEAQEGDAAAAEKRLAILRGAEILETTDEALALADTLVRAHALPEKARADAVHVASAAIRGADVLLTWNCRHIANGVMLPKIYSTLEKAGYRPPAIVTPLQLLDAGENEP
jgi:hypothetical protein